jgi:DNA repair protein RadC
MEPEHRPRERLINKGPEALSNTELLAVLLNTGIKGRNVSQLAADLLRLLDRSRGIPQIQDISRLSGMGDSKACAVAAMLEFGRRRWGASGSVVTNPAEIFSLVRHYADRKQERFISLSLNGAHEVLAVRVVTVGLVNRTIVHPREVFADILQDRAAAFIVAHNHPSGKISPSPEDNEITDRLQKAAVILGLHFLDHLIFSETNWWSYRQEGLLKN